MNIRAFLAFPLLTSITAVSAFAQNAPQSNVDVVQNLIDQVQAERARENQSRNAPAATPPATNDSTSNTSSNNPAPDTPTQPTSAGQSGAGIGGPIGQDLGAAASRELEQQLEQRFVGPRLPPPTPLAAGNNAPASAPNPVQNFTQNLAAQSGLFTRGPGTTPESSFTDNSTPASPSNPPPSSAPNIMASSVPGEADPYQSSYPAIAAAQETLHGYEAAIPATTGSIGRGYEHVAAELEVVFDDLSMVGRRSEPAGGWPAIPLEVLANNIGPAAQ